MWRGAAPVFFFWFGVIDLILLALAWPFRDTFVQTNTCECCGRSCKPGAFHCEEWYERRK